MRRQTRATSNPVYQVVRYQWGHDPESATVVFQTVNPKAATIYRDVQQWTVGRRAGGDPGQMFVFGVRQAPPERPQRS